MDAQPTKSLVVGASGATGRRLVEQLLAWEQRVKVIVRPSSDYPVPWNTHERVNIIKRNISEINVEEMSEYLSDCHAIASCLGHNLNLKGVFGRPGRLVADAVQLLCEATIKNNSEQPIKVILMNTAGNRNRDLQEQVSPAEKMTIALLRGLLPPHADNEKAADYLRVNIGREHPAIEWIALRPDSLIDEESVSDYTIHPSPTRSAIFDPGKTSRINVAHLMARLITDDALWDQWKGQMPVIYNTTAPPE